MKQVVRVVDGWEFFRPYEGSELRAVLTEYHEVSTDLRRQGKCVECGDFAASGTVRVYSPSGREFDFSYRTRCCDKVGGGIYNLVDGKKAEDLLQSYPEAETNVDSPVDGPHYSMDVGTFLKEGRF